MLLAAREAGYRSLMRLSSRAFLDTPPNEPPHLKLAWLEGETDGPDRAHRRPGRAARSRRSPPGRADSPRRALRGAGSGCSATGSMSSCSATARRAERATEPALIELAYAQGHAAGRHQRAVISRPREDYEAHDALICIAEGRVIAETDRRQLTPSITSRRRAEMAALFADLPEALASTVEIAAALRLPAAHAQADPAALLRRRRRRATRPPSCARAPRRASTRRLATARPRARPHRRRLPRAARLRARRHRAA